jgi:hypothetical protein
MDSLSRIVQHGIVRAFGAVVLTISCHAADTAASLAVPWPLGTLQTNSLSDGECPQGYKCQGFTVTVPSASETIQGFLAVGPARSTARGVIMAFTGGGGSVYWTEQEPAVYALGEELRSLGFTIVQVRWRGNWLHSSPGNDAGTAHLGARPATVVKHVYDTYYAPLGLTSAQAGQAGFALTGNSAGSTQTALSLCYYGLDEIIDVAVLTGGPPHSALAKSSLTNLDEQDYWFNLDTRQFVDRGFGFFDGDGPAARHDPTFATRWWQESLATGGNDYFHPKTRIHFIIGDDDMVIGTNAGDYFQRLRAEKTPYLTWEIAPKTGHPVYASEPGRQAIKNALLGFSTAIPTLFNGDRHEGTIAVAGEEDSWVFAVKNGYSLVVRAAAGTTLAPRLRLYDPDDLLVAEANSNVSTSQPDAVLTHQAAKKGTYKVVISAASFEQTEPYQLYFARAPGIFMVPEADEGGNLQNGESRSGSIELGDLDMWRVIAVAGMEIQFRVQSTSFTPWIRLYGPVGALVGEGKANGGQSIREAVLNVRANNDGSYIAIIGASLPGQTGAYDLNLDLTSPAYGFRLAVLPPNSSTVDVQIVGDLGVAYELQGSADLAGWESLLSSRLTESPFTYRDTDTASRSMRFYRLLSSQP